MGLLLAVAVTSAAVDDAAAAPKVLGQLTRKSFPRLRKLWADTKYHNHALNRWVSKNGWYVIEIVSRLTGHRRFNTKSGKFARSCSTDCVDWAR